MMLHEKYLYVKQNIKSKLKSYPILSYFGESWSMSWPMILIMFFEFFMGLTDVYIGGLLGKEVQASTGLASQVYTFFIMAGHAVTVGAVAVISRLFASTDRVRFKQAIFTAVVSVICAAVILSIGGVLFAQSLLKLIKAPDNIMVYAVPLLQIYSVGLFFHLVLTTMNGILRSCRMMKLVMKIMILSSVLNILFNIFFVFYTPLGFRGIALSTTVSIIISFLIVSKVVYKLIDKTYIFSSQLLKQILSIGWPSGIVSISWQFAATALYTIISSLPTNAVDVMAAYSIGLRIESAIYLPAFAFNMANATIVGNLLGAKKYNEAYKSGMTTAFISVFIITIMTVIVILNARGIATKLSSSPLVIDEVMKYLYICMISEPFVALNLAMVGALNGAGDTKATMRYAVIAVWVIRIPLAYLIGVTFGFGAVGIWWGLNSGFFLHAFLSTRRFMSKKWIKEL